MPRRVPHPCNQPGCRQLTLKRFCEQHAVADRKRVDQSRQSSADRGYDRQWRRFRAAYAARVPAICVDCGRAYSGRAMHLDHITPIAQGGGKYDEDNLAWRCRWCHSAKTAREDGGFGRQVDGSPQRGGRVEKLEGRAR